MNPFLEFIEKNSTFPNINPLSYQEINHNCPRCQKNNPKYECQKCNHFWCSDHSCQHLKIPSKSIIKILDNCPICLTGYSQKTSYQLTPCNHTFHFDCIKKWLFLNDDCPYCRTKVSNNPYKCEENEFKRFQAVYLEFLMDYIQF